MGKGNIFCLYPGGRCAKSAATGATTPVSVSGCDARNAPPDTRAAVVANVAADLPIFPDFLDFSKFSDFSKFFGFFSDFPIFPNSSGFFIFPRRPPGYKQNMFHFPRNAISENQTWRTLACSFSFLALGWLASMPFIVLRFAAISFSNLSFFLRTFPS